MNSGFRLTRAGEQTTSVWSGGTTTELAIFPAGASYAARNFEWRLSTAVVTAGESTFTSLPNWQRLLMVLSGQMQLEHAGQHRVTLLPFAQDRFSGSWRTRCVGTGRDFNLMFAAGWQGSLQAVQLLPGKSVQLGPSSARAFEAVYCLSGGVQLCLQEGQQPVLGAGDLLLLQPDQLSVSGLSAAAQTEPAVLIRASIWLGQVGDR